MTVGERIKRRRLELGLSQEELATKMGYSGKSSVCKAETFGDNITTTKVMKYAKALDVSFEYLMGWDGSDLIYAQGEEDAKILIEINKLSPSNRAVILATIATMIANQNE